MGYDKFYEEHANIDITFDQYHILLMLQTTFLCKVICLIFFIKALVSLILYVAFIYHKQ